MNISFKIASDFAIKLYISGLASGSKSFAPLSFSDREYFRNQIIGKIPDIFSLGNNYDDAKKIKSEILLGRITDFLGEEQEKVDNVELKNIDLKNANSLQNDLELSFKKSAKQIEDYFSSKSIDSGISITVFIMPMTGELAEALDGIIVVGDGFSKDIAFPILLEEIIHCLLDNNTVDDIVSSLELIDSAQLIKEEIIAGFLLYELLIKLNYSKDIIDSVVFDWHGGDRAPFVKKLI